LRPFKIKQRSGIRKSWRYQQWVTFVIRAFSSHQKELEVFWVEGWRERDLDPFCLVPGVK
jgi:hypothetical protein